MNSNLIENQLYPIFFLIPHTFNYLAISFEDPDFEIDEPRAEYVYTEICFMYIDHLIKQGVSPEDIPNYKDELNKILLKGAEVDTIVPGIIDKELDSYANNTFQ